MKLNRKTYAVVAIVVVLIALVAFFKLRGGSGRWQCINNQWTAVGNPGVPAPQTPCVGTGAVATIGPGAAAAPTPLSSPGFHVEGVIASEDGPPTGWKIFSGGAASYLIFTTTSQCDFGHGFGSCPAGKSAVNVIGKKVYVEGNVTNGKVVVTKLNLVQ